MITGLITVAGLAAAIALLIVRYECKVRRGAAIRKEKLLAKQSKLLEDALKFKRNAQLPDALWVVETEAALEHYKEIKNV